MGSHSKTVGFVLLQANRRKTFLQMQTATGGGLRETDVWLALQMGWKIPHHHLKTLTLFLSQDRKCALLP